MAKSNFLPIFLTVGLLAVGGGALYLATKKEDGTELKIPTLDEIIAYITGLFGGGGNGNGNGNGGGTGGAKIVLGASSVKQGQTISIQASGFKAGQRIGFWATPANNASVTIGGDNKNMDSKGGVKFDFSIPANAPTGASKMWALDRNSKEQATALFSIAAATSGGGNGGGTTGGSITFGAAGDWGSGRNSNWRKTADGMKAAGVDIMLGLGDYSYTNVSDWQKVTNYLKTKEIMSRGVEGNHDSSAYAKTFANQSSMLNTFTSGPAVFILLNTENSVSTNVAFAEKTLKATTKPWKIMAMHKPLYTNSSKHSAERSLANALKPIINKYKVQLVMYAHNHNYQRIVLPDHPNTVFICSGSGGESLYGLKGGQSGTKKTNDSNYGFTKISISGSTLKGSFIAHGGKVIDSWTQTLGATANLAYTYPYQVMEARISA